MNPYKLDLEKISKYNPFYAYFRLLSWIILIYASVWVVIGTGLFLALKLGK